MRKILKLLVFSFLLTTVFSLNHGNTLLVHADIAMDSELDDPVKGKMSQDDFPNPEDWAAYLEEHPEEGIMLLEDGYPENHMHVTPELAYTITGLKSTRVIQTFYVEGEYLYVTQRIAADGFEADLRLSRCLINEEDKTAVYQDSMTLKNFGHGQTLEIYTYKEKQYVWVACKANTEYDNAWALQFGRIEYEAGKTISNYTKISRFADLMYANTDSTKFGSVKRADMALSTDESKVMIWAQDVNNNVQYSIYRADVLNAYLDMADLLDSKYVSFNNDRMLKQACLYSFVQSGQEVVLPNGSNQGIEVGNDSSNYIAGANIGETPQIAVMTPGTDGTYSSYSNLITLVHDDFDSQTEMEGVQLTHTGIYFGVANHADKKQQYIYYFPYESIGQDSVHSETVIKNAKAATCTEAGYTGDICCSGCGEILEPGEEIPKLAHNYDAGTVIKAAQVAIDGTMRYTCQTCGATEDKTIPKTGITPAKGTSFTYSGVTYKVMKKAANNTFTGGELAYMGQVTKTKSVTIPKTVTVQGVTYKITSIGKNAFKNRKDLTTLKISSNINRIYSYAFYGCSKLKNITVSTTKLTSSKVGAKAFKGIPSSAKINVVNKKISSYRTIFRKKGLNKKVKIY